MNRALLIVLDSVGVGHAPDAAAYGDGGADTLGHLYGSIAGLRLPTLESLGLSAIRRGAAGEEVAVDWLGSSSAAWMVEQSAGKDTTSGHWELAGQPVTEPFDVFESFPDEILGPIRKITGLNFLGNYPQSGTVILEELGAEHVSTGHPILYTSADSVLQIAAHEEVMPYKELHRICRVAREVCDASRFRVGRVIARPFSGSGASFERTANRKDFSLHPPVTVLKELQRAGVPVTGVGKISDIFAGEGIDQSFPTKSNAAGMAEMDRLWASDQRGLIFVNLVDCDSKYGHRRDPEGYARCLLEFDQWLGSFVPRVGPDDLVLITADHGNDPTWKGTDHTREKVPLLVLGPSPPSVIGERATFADVAATLAEWFGLPRSKRKFGRSFLSPIR